MIPSHKNPLSWLLLAAALTQGACGLIAGLKDYTSPEQGNDGEQGGADAGVSGPEVIAEGQGKPQAIAVSDGRYVFWANEDNHTLWRKDVSKSVAAEAELVADTGANTIWSLAVDVDHVYWTASHPPFDGCNNTPAQVGRASLVRTFPDGGPPDGGTLDIRWEGDSCSGIIVGIFVDGSNLYWAAPVRGSVFQMPKALTNMAKEAMSQPGTASVWADTSTVYWAAHNDSQIRARETAAFQDTRDILMTDRPLAIVGDKTNLYWTTEGGQVLKREKDGTDAGAPIVLADKQGPITSLALDEEAVYFTVPSAGEIRRVPSEGGEVEAVVDKQNDPRRVVVDQSYLYWTTYAGGRVFRMKKR